MSKITFLGGGSFGSALAVLLAEKNNVVNIYNRDKNVVDEINIKRTNEKYLKDLYIPKGVTAFNNIEEAVDGADYIVLSVPSHVIRNMCIAIKGKIPNTIPIISIAKGIEEDSDKRLSVVIEEELDNPVVVLSGPSHAEEVVMKIPTTIVSTSKDMKAAAKVQDLFMTPYFRVYTNDDIIGVEIGGAVKNVIALAAGIIDGLGYGDNTKAALLTRGMKEISRVGIALGGRAETFYGLTGMGDLIVTCTSMHSRNRRAGLLIGKGMSLEEALKEIGMVVEGVKACRAFYQLKEKIGISMPITDGLYKGLFEGKNAKSIVDELMNRDKKSELF
ncbi:MULTISPECIES: NAD(P)H-dependent glycerol-3-phosphate dehydrogenase [unclassified Clostridium]|uniref:NAD(P)H-dependent glycerol-3-phosphate dehydrogenase n=1 Tax=unclassified Clostridium TaxID=2614128 RepID=UPI0002972801|nr:MULTISPECIES: NAD(P)H-dependent glycerol-3-phosphate dehydrogenase [unclassified Clostridium]EKQ54015.1 MAG: glycerol-3-phosphate dehydrogenase [Clostridium sp. Maddingley MBC34-26]